MSMASSYDQNHEFRGTALIIGNEFKGQKGCQRDGCDKDMIMMEDVFRKLDFKVTMFKNLSVASMRQKLENASRDRNNEKCDCFAFALSTHGHEVRLANVRPTPEADVWRHGVLGEDGNTLFVDEIIDYFTDDKAYGLVGKPKLFFLQACRSRIEGTIYSPSQADKYDPGVKVNVSGIVDKSTGKFKKRSPPDVKDAEDCLHNLDITDAVDIYKDWEKDPDEWNPETSAKSPGAQASEQDAAGGTSEEDAGGSGDSNDIPPSAFDVVPIKCPDDFLIMYPVISGKFAFRNSQAGSYLLKFLHQDENLKKMVLGFNVLQYLTYVCQAMARYEYKPNLDDISYNNRIREKQARLSGKYFDPLGTFKTHLYGCVKYLSPEENQDLLVRVTGKAHASNLRGDVATVEPYLRSIIETLTEQQMKDILNEILPFKMTACLVHRLRDNVVFQPKGKDTPMGKLKTKLLPPEMRKKETTV